MLTTPFSKRLVGVVASIDRRLTAVGQSCCLGRSQSALQRELKLDSATAATKQQRTGDDVRATAASVGKRA
jgi:hypothetical protein